MLGRFRGKFRMDEGQLKLPFVVEFRVGRGIRLN
jgi:hypothetical protein